MVNMDYPGPCPSCSAIESCGDEASRKKVIASYCDGMQMELNAWKARLYDTIVEIGSLGPKDQAGIEDAMVTIKSLVKEIEGIMDQLKTHCPATITEQEQLIGSKLAQLRAGYTNALRIISPGMFGG